MTMAQSLPLISIIVPCYNTEQYVERCVCSILAQSYSAERMEIILVDDGSTDRTGALLDAIAAENANVQVFHQTNAGSAAARNLGIRKSSGEYLGFVDSDDYISPDMYQNLVDALQNTGCGIAQTGRDEISPEGERLPDVIVTPTEQEIVGDEEFLRQLLMHTGDSSYCTKLTARRLFTEENLFPEGMLNEDFYLLFHMLPASGGVVRVADTGYHVFYREGSNTRRRSENVDDFPQAFTDIVKNADAVTGFVQERYPALMETALRFGFVQRLDYMLHIPISRMTSENAFYQSVVAYLRSHRREREENTLLTRKQKLYLRLLTIAPKKTRQIHAWTLKIRNSFKAKSV